MLDSERCYILLPRPTGTPSKIEGELGSLRHSCAGARKYISPTILLSFSHTENNIASVVQ